MCTNFYSQLLLAQTSSLDHCCIAKRGHANKCTILRHLKKKTRSSFEEGSKSQLTIRRYSKGKDFKLE